MKLKLVISLILALLVFVLISQNAATVTVHFLSWSAVMSLVVLVFIVLVTGMAMGWLLNSYLRYARTHKEKKTKEIVRAEELAPDGETGTDEKRG